MAGGIAGPDDKVDRVLELVTDPVKGGIDERYGRVAVGRLGTIVTCRAVASMACAVRVDRGMNLVEGVWMEVCSMTRDQLVTYRWSGVY